MPHSELNVSAELERKIGIISTLVVLGCQSPTILSIFFLAHTFFSLSFSSSPTNNLNISGAQKRYLEFLN